MCPVSRACQHVFVVNAGIDKKCMAPETEIVEFGLGNDAKRLSIRQRSIGKNQSGVPDVSSITRAIPENNILVAIEFYAIFFCWTPAAIYENRGCTCVPSDS